ncbi:MAG: endo-1,3-alpha-glucanase family glycosylhydrolase [Kiritimatiellales bacterium]
MQAKHYLFFSLNICAAFLCTVPGAAKENPLRGMVLVDYMSGQKLSQSYNVLCNPYHTGSAVEEVRATLRDIPMFSAGAWKTGETLPWGATAKDAMLFDFALMKRFGIDAICLNYGMGVNKWPDPKEQPHGLIAVYKPIIEALKERPDLKVLFQMDQAYPNGILPPKRVREEGMEDLFDHYLDTPNLLRDEKGNVVIDTYRANILDPSMNADDIPAHTDRFFQDQRQVVANWQEILAKLGERYDTNFVVFADMPPAWSFVPQLETGAITGVAKLTQEQRRQYFDLWAEPFLGIKFFGVLDDPERTQAVYNDAIDSNNKFGKLSVIPVWHGWHRVWNKRIAFDGWYNLIKTFENTRRANNPVIKVIIWNDYQENSQLAPTFRQGFGKLLILDHYLKRFKTGEEPAVEKDVVILHYPPYLGNPVATDFHTVLQCYQPLRDFVHVAVFAKEDSTLVFGNETRSVSAGLSFHEFDAVPGKQAASLLRSNEPVAQVEGLYEIFDGIPYRTDKVPYIWSSECHTLFREYAGYDLDPHDGRWADINENGIADWFELCQPDKKVQRP